MKTLTDIDISLAQLREIGELDVRSFNLCKRNGFDTVRELIEYHEEVGDFRGLQNCGHISDLTLKKICRKYSNLNENALHIHSKPVEFNNTERALRALRSGFIDVLVITRGTVDTTTWQNQLSGVIGVCHGEPKYY